MSESEDLGSIPRAAGFLRLYVHINKCTSIFEHYGRSNIRDIRTSTAKGILKNDKHKMFLNNTYPI